MDEPAVITPPGVAADFDDTLIRGALSVYQDGKLIGIITDTGSDWLNGSKPIRVLFRVRSAGPGVPVPEGPFPTAEGAADAIVETRRTHRAWLTPGPDGLSGYDRAALEFESTPDAEATDGRRENAINALFGVTPTRHAAHVARLLREQRTAATAAYPNAVAALDRRATRRRRPKTARRSAVDL